MRDYLAEMRETEPIYLADNLVHPGMLQRIMNRVLVDNVDARAVDSRRLDGCSCWRRRSATTVLTARAKVTANYDKKGHRFVELDALIVANGTTPVAHCHHVAIFAPREQAAA